MKKIFLCALFFPCCLMAAGKVASLSPTVTQLVIYLGGSDRLCGRSSACYFPEVSHLPVVGDMGRPYPEAVLQSRAAWVISDARHPDANWKILQRCRISLFFPDTGNIDALPGNLRKLGKILAIPGAEAKAAAVENRIAALRRSASEKKVKAAILFGTAPLITCGKDSFISGAMELAGVENIAADAGKGYFILSCEFLYQANPEVIIIIGVPENIARKDLEAALLRSLPAVKKRQVIFVDSDKWSRLTPEIIDAAEKLRRHLSR